MRAPTISVVTPTLKRPLEVAQLLYNLKDQSLLPFEVIIIDGAPAGIASTEEIVISLAPELPYKCRYIRHAGGTAMQRNVGIDVAEGNFTAFVDDDIRLAPDFFQQLMIVFEKDEERKVGGVAGYITNQYLDPNTSSRWRWYKRLGLFTTYEPGRYDYETGYPINRYMQAPYSGVRAIDFAGAGCAMWRSEVFKNGLRFDKFFADYGVLEDAHFALRAGRQWALLECGTARCLHLRAAGGRVNRRAVARKTATNYRYVFIDIVRDRTRRQEFRFWRVQLVDLIRLTLYALRYMEKGRWQDVLGKLEGIGAAIFIKAGQQ